MTSETNPFIERLSFWLFVFTLAWAPFPLGSNRPWSWSLLALLVAAIWLLWCWLVWKNPETVFSLWQGLLGPTILVLLALGWGVAQVVPFISAGWGHPAWRVAAGILGIHASPTISMSPWRTETELMKLCAYAMAFWIARWLARVEKGAVNLLNALIVIGAFYAVYGFTLKLMGYSQFEMFYGMPLEQGSQNVTGPFVNRNNYATYEGLIALCAAGRFVSRAWNKVGTKDIRTQLFGIWAYSFGPGAGWLVASVLAFSVVIATASRAGNLATWLAAAALLLIGLIIPVRRRGGWFGWALISSALLAAVALLEMNGAALASRLDDIAANGATDVTRLLLWKNAAAMIHTAPLTGWGLGTYQIVYPLFSKVAMPFVMDKAHNDYLELAAGWGLPAAIVWWVALMWLVWICWYGIFHRGRNRIYSALAVCGSILVAIHSIFDFSLQMPAIALTYATILGMGTAQSFSTRHNTQGRLT